MQNQDDFYLSDSQTEDDNIISYIMQTYVPFWPWFVISLAITMSVAVVYLKYTNPTYQVNAKLLVKDEKKASTPARCWMR